MSLNRELVSRSNAAREFGVTHRTIQNWEASKVPGFDAPIKINGRVYHRRDKLEAVKILGLQPQEAAQ
jgi:DNA-binding transcriptional MerR regulator